MKINLSKIADVYRFNNAAMKLPCDIELRSDRWRVNGKSIMGIFSLDLSNPIDFSLDTDDDSVISSFKRELSDIITE